MSTIVGISGARAAAAVVRHSQTGVAGSLRPPLGAVVAIAEHAFMGFGMVRYLEATSDQALTLSPDTSAQIVMTIDPTQTVNALQAPFAATPFWNGQKIVARQANDVFEVRVTMNVTTMLAGGHLDLVADLLVGNTANGGPVLDTGSATLPSQAGSLERVGYKLLLFAGATLTTTGAGLFLTSSVPVTVSGFSILIVPISAGS
ncbi:hypothetical protein [Beijerinckia sp. L45]|uniref:hypothetical protein n=1 Tax=Beijerinckia sp. L45 TaxID=1641855 RepID=UPI00131A6999|nr:hypothetical protein [Beijerinckia sp. L45]